MKGGGLKFAGADEKIVNNILFISEDAGVERTDTETNIADDASQVNRVNFVTKWYKIACFSALKHSTQPNKNIGIEKCQVTDPTSAIQRCYDKTTFRGILVDSVCSQICTGGAAHYLKYFIVFWDFSSGEKVPHLVRNLGTLPSLPEVWLKTHAF